MQLHAWGLPPIEVLRTLDAYNAAVIADRGELLHPPRRGNPFPVLQPPFSAALVRSGITFTCGGLRCDLDMRVLRRAQSVSTLPLVTAGRDEVQYAAVPGLFAAGCDVLLLCHTLEALPDVTARLEDPHLEERRAEARRRLETYRQRLRTLRSARDYINLMREGKQGERLDNVRQAFEQMQTGVQEA